MKTYVLKNNKYLFLFSATSNVLVVWSEEKCYISYTMNTKKARKKKRDDWKISLTKFPLRFKWETLIFFYSGGDFWWYRVDINPRFWSGLFIVLQKSFSNHNFQIVIDLRKVNWWRHHVSLIIKSIWYGCYWIQTNVVSICNLFPVFR